MTLGEIQLLAKAICDTLRAMHCTRADTWRVCLSLCLTEYRDALAENNTDDLARMENAAAGLPDLLKELHPTDPQASDDVTLH